jgi:hypothetical protein
MVKLSLRHPLPKERKKKLFSRKLMEVQERKRSPKKAEKND